MALELLKTLCFLTLLIYVVYGHGHNSVPRGENYESRRVISRIGTCFYFLIWSDIFPDRYMEAVEETEEVVNKIDKALDSLDNIDINSLSKREGLEAYYKCMTTKDEKSVMVVKMYPTCREILSEKREDDDQLFLQLRETMGYNLDNHEKMMRDMIEDLKYYDEWNYEPFISCLEEPMSNTSGN